MNLETYIGERLEKPFVWGEHDCVLFAIGWVNIRAGRNLLAHMPAWSSAKEALRVAQQLGGMEAELDRRLTRIHPGLAKNGDVALIGRTCFLFSGPYIVAPGEAGLIFADRTKALCAWSC